MKRMLIIGISQFMIGFISYRCHKIALSKDSMLARRKEVYITYFYYVICNYTMILALGIMFFYIDILLKVEICFIKKFIY